MVQSKAKIVANRIIQGNYLHLSIAMPRIAKVALPGQFLTIRLTKERGGPLLRRPFSIHRVKGKSIELLYEVVGHGSQILSRKKPGEYLDIIGPLGNGFDYMSPSHSLGFARDKHVTRSPVLVAGGMGVAPLLFLAEKMQLVTRSLPRLRSGQAGHQATRSVLLGAKTQSQILCEKEFKNLGFGVKIATDDGSRGFKGKVTDLLKKILRANGLTGERATIFACGPRPMLKEISRISQQYKVPAQISLEEHMACGIGACLGCVVNTRQGYQRACKEGPVFKASEIIWD